MAGACRSRKPRRDQGGGTTEARADAAASLAQQAPPPEANLPRPRPVTAERAGTGSQSPSGARQAIRRGILIHRLLQSLPDLPVERRADAGRRWLSQPLHGLADEQVEALLAEVLAVLETPDFAPIFGPGSQAEVPIAGLLDGPDGPLALSGQLDRLFVGPQEILVVDYKTNRPPPEHSRGVARAYLKQMAAYRALLQRIYPTRHIRCALLWTDIPRLMPLEDELLEGVYSITGRADRQTWR